MCVGGGGREREEGVEMPCLVSLLNYGNCSYFCRFTELCYGSCFLYVPSEDAARQVHLCGLICVFTVSIGERIWVRWGLGQVVVGGKLDFIDAQPDIVLLWMLLTLCRQHCVSAYAYGVFITDFLTFLVI